MKEFLDKIPHGVWEEFRKRVMAACKWTDEQWKNRLTGRTELTEAERIVMRTVWVNLQNEVINGINTNVETPYSVLEKQQG